VLWADFDYHQRCWWYLVSWYSSASAPSWTLTTVADAHKFSAVRRLSCRILDLSKDAIFIYLTCIWRFRWGWSHRNFVEIFCVTGLHVKSLGYCERYFEILRLVVLIQYWLDKQTHGHTMTAYIPLAYRRAGKNCTFKFHHFFLHMLPVAVARSSSSALLLARRHTL